MNCYCNVMNHIYRDASMEEIRRAIPIYEEEQT